MIVSDPQQQLKFEIKRKRLEVLEAQQATFAMLTPPHIVIEIAELRAELADWQKQRIQVVLRAHDLLAQPPQPSKGLIVLVSPQGAGDSLHALGAYQAIDYHRPPLSHCWLIATKGVSGSAATAEALAAHFRNYRVNCQVCIVSNGLDAAETLALVNSIYTSVEASTLSETDLIADITGATKAMAAGMVLACGATRPMQYMVFQLKGVSLPVRINLSLTKEPT